tara:strand:+ start:126 stop:1391 length:1266 start_codon:yes stop_codon:yes gene_type:complete
MEIKIAIIGIGYVGLPLLVKLSKFYKVLGFDIDQSRIYELQDGYDRTNEITDKNLLKSDNIYYTSNQFDLKDANIFIITVPTPVDEANNPDFSFLKNACLLVGNHLSKNNIVIFESTVYPGSTREICIPILEEVSKLKLNKDFGVGYSPERINPGDKKHTIENVVKIISGSDIETLNRVDQIYKKIISAGTFKTSSIEIAEAAKVIENTQRDLNIALMNELSIIFNQLNLSMNEILEAASTKWNFLNFKPGLVGGHCIGVDPYYLTYKSLEIGYKPELILAGRKINDYMSSYVVNEFVKLAFRRKVFDYSKRILVMGITFKENCPDTRNSKSLDIVNQLLEFNLEVDIYDPVANLDLSTINSEAQQVNKLAYREYAGIIITVAHHQFTLLNINDLKNLCIKDSIIFDVKNLYPPSLTDLNL